MQDDTGGRFVDLDNLPTRVEGKMILLFALISTRQDIDLGV